MCRSWGVGKGVYFPHWSKNGLLDFALTFACPKRPTHIWWWKRSNEWTMRKEESFGILLLFEFALDSHKKKKQLNGEEPGPFKLWWGHTQ